MVREIAYLVVDPARADAFEAAVARAGRIFLAAEGCHGMTLDRVVEDPARYRLTVLWDSVDHHMVLFRQSPLFAEWRALAGPFFVEPPVVEHWAQVVGG